MSASLRIELLIPAAESWRSKDVPLFLDEYDDPWLAGESVLFVVPEMLEHYLANLG